MDVTPLVEKRLSTLVERIVEEIHSRFPQGVKIYEIQNIVEHECWKLRIRLGRGVYYLSDPT